MFNNLTSEYEIRIYTISGTLVHEGNQDSAGGSPGEYQWCTDGVAPGVYIVYITDSINSVYMKIIVR